MRILPSLCISTLSLVLGAGVGFATRAPHSPGTDAAIPGAVEEPEAITLELPPQAPPFSGTDASIDWVRSQVRRGDPAAAERLFHADAGLTGRQRIELAQGLLGEFQRMDPRLLARIVAGLPRDEASDRLLWTLAAKWSISDADAALRFIESLPPERLNSIGLLTNSAPGLAMLPAERVLAFAATLDDGGRAYLAEGLLGATDFTGAWRNTWDILSKLDIAPMDDSPTVEWMLGASLAEIEPQALELEIAAATESFKRDEMLRGYAHTTGMNDAPRGIEIAARIENGEARQEAVSLNARRWLAADRGAALAWLRSDAAVRLLGGEGRAKLLRIYNLPSSP